MFDTVRLINQAIELAGEIKTVYVVVTIQKKRLFLRAFQKRIELIPDQGSGRAMIFLMPGFDKVNGNNP